MDLLGRYYTQAAFSNLLVSNITIEQPQKVLELGAGGGALLAAATARWTNAEMIAADIDTNSIKAISSTLPKVSIYQLDCLDTKLFDQFRSGFDTVDVAVCNPPYLRIKGNAAFKTLFNSANLSGCESLPVLTSDLVFLAQNLSLLKKEGQLGIILPDSIIAGQDFTRLRELLLTNHKITKIIQLPERIFPKTEALTHILFIEKGSSCNSYIDLYKTGVSGVCEEHILVESSKLIERMDYKFHDHIEKHSKDSVFVTLGELSPIIERGNVENAILKKSKLSQVHTTTIVHKDSKLKFKKVLAKKHKKKFKVGSPGDILLARVGRGCIGKVSMVSSGNAILSDCLYKISVKTKYRKLVFESLISDDGQRWLTAMSHGVCAKVLSKKDLLNFPVQQLKDCTSNSR